jgi:hypothetical protein
MIEINEGVSNFLSTVALIASMIAIPGITNAANLEKDLAKIPPSEFSIYNSNVTKALNNNAKNKKTYGGMTYTNLVNLVAGIAYHEGMLDYIRTNEKGQKYDDRILQAIIWTIINRAGGDPNKFKDVILKASQYVSKKHIPGAMNLIDGKEYIIYHPGMGYSKKTWRQCEKFAKMAIAGNLPMPKDDNGVPFGNKNMIANEEIDDEKSYDDWGKKCSWTVGGKTRNCYGYDSTHDGYKGKTIKKSNKKTSTDTISSKTNSVKTNIKTKQQTSSKKQTAKKKYFSKVYTIRKDDTLTKIAKIFKTTVDDILDKNSKLKKDDILQIGQKIFI